MYEEERSSKSALTRVVLLVALGAAVALAQPSISGLQASSVGGSAANVGSITSGLNLQGGGFWLYINGTFSVGVSPTVTWTNPASPGQSGTLTVQGNPSGTQIVALVPNNFFNPQVNSNQTVGVTVTQNNATSNSFPFLIVPIPVAAPSPLPSATVGVPYSAPVAIGGTEPFSPFSTVGIPAGLQFSNTGDTIVGTPLGPPGTSTITGATTDFWGVTVDLSAQITVLALPTVGAVQSSAGTTYPYGTLTNLSVNVTSQSTPQPTGSVNILDNGLPLVSGALSGTTATISGVFLPIGTHPLTGHYSGDSIYAAANSPSAANINVVRATPTFQLTGNPFSGSFGGTMSSGTIKVVGAASPALPPSGFLTLVSGAVQLGTFVVAPGVPVNISGVQLPTTLGAGVQPLTFIYSGDFNYQSANQGASVGIQQVTPSFTVTAKTNPILVGQTETFTATVSAAGLPTPTGFALFSDNNNPISAAINLVNGVGTFNTSSLSIGVHNISALYSGDQNFTAVISQSIQVTVSANPLVFTTNFLPAGVAFQPYSATIGVSGGQTPYSFSITGLPSPLTFDSKTGTISGTAGVPGTYPVTINVTDSLGTKITLGTNLLINPPAVQISTPSNLPTGTVGVGYSATIGVVGGADPITYSLIGGTLPPGLSFKPTSNGALVTGTPTTVGTYTFTVKVVDSLNTSDTRDFTIVIKPPPLTIGGSATITGTVGVPLNASFGCTGGVTPYTTSITGSLPPGMSFANCGISGTPTQAGTFGIHLLLTDSAGTSIGKDIGITINSPVLALAGGSLPDGQVGAPYKAAVAATGGVPPITYSAIGLPDGLSMASTGDITGTPTTAGPYSVKVTATDSSKVTAPVSVTSTYTLNIAPVSLAFGAANLPDGTVGVAYSGSVSATGGSKTYTFTASGLPDGLTMSSGGAVSGTPTTAGTSTVNVTVTDSNGATARATYTIKIAAPQLVISTASAPNGTVGTPYSATFTATGGSQPYTFTASGQPSTLTMSAGGTLSGTPTAPGTFTLTVTVKDGNGITVSRSYPVNIALPVSPPLNFGGITTTVNPAQQSNISVSLGSPYPTDVQVTLTLTVKPDSGPADPAVQFATGGSTATLTIPAGSLTSSTTVGLQTGTVAGTITVTAKLTADGVDVTPSPAPTSATRVNAGPPVIISATGTRTSTGFTITVVGYVTDREMTTATFGFNGSNLGTQSLTLTVDTLFAGWLGGNSPPSAQFGSQFTYTQPFTVNGTSPITSVTVTLNNKSGASNTVTVTLN